MKCDAGSVYDQGDPRRCEKAATMQTPPNLAPVTYACGEHAEQFPALKWQTIARPCPFCHGRGTVSEDPMPGCPGFGYEEHGCQRCGGSGEEVPECMADRD